MNRLKWNPRRFFKILGLSVLGIFLAANLFLIISGKFYIYKAIYSTYFRGQTGPGIYDSSIFYNRTIEKGESVPWAVHPRANSVRLEKATLEKLEELETTSLLVIKDNFIIYEHYWDEHTDTTRSNSFSVAKSIVSLMIGKAIEEGHIKSVDEPVGNYLESFKEGEKAKVTIRHLLTMSAGLSWEESGGNPFSHNAEAYYGWDLKALVEDLEVVEEPGKVFDYKSGYTQILGFVLEEATGMHLAEYASKKFWQKLGAENEAFWSLDDEHGMEKAFCCFYATTRDFARIGRLVLEKGDYKSTPIINSAYIDEMITPDESLMTRAGLNNEVYGYQWWIYNHPEGSVYYARGILGQYIICLPEEDIIVVRTGHTRGNVIRNPNEDPSLSLYKIDHPSDLFMYVEIAKSLGAQF